jgi:hypothetical protein
MEACRLNLFFYDIVMELTHDEIDQLYAEPSVAMHRAEAVLAEFTDGSQAAAMRVRQGECGMGYRVCRPSHSRDPSVCHTRAPH